MNQTNPQRGLGRGMLLFAWIIALALLTWYFNGWLERRQNPNQLPASRVTDAVREVVLVRNPQHHYVATGTINGQPVTFLLDTGATHVAVPPQVAEVVGLQAGAREWANTANGVIETRATVIDQLTLGAIELSNVRASITHGLTGDWVLLGMSALQHVEFSQRDGILTLRQYN